MMFSGRSSPIRRGMAATYGRCSRLFARSIARRAGRLFDEPLDVRRRLGESYSCLDSAQPGRAKSNRHRSVRPCETLVARLSRQLTFGFALLPAPVEEWRWSVESSKHPVAVYLGRQSSSVTRQKMRRVIEQIARGITGSQLGARELNWSMLRYQHTAAIRAQLAQSGLAPSTCRLYLSALRGVLREAWRLGYTKAGQYMRAVDLPAIAGQRLLRGRVLDAGELRRLFESCSEDAKRPRGARDAAALALLYGAGLRRSELAELPLDAFNALEKSVRVKGKGNRERLVPLPEGAVRAVETWLQHRGKMPGSLVCPVKSKGLVGEHALSSQAVLSLLRRRAMRAAVGAFSPHDLRRSYVTHLLDAGADVLIVSRLAGHAQVSTTQVYDRRGERAGADAVTRLHVPFSEPTAGAPAC